MRCQWSAVAQPTRRLRALLGTRSQRLLAERNEAALTRFESLERRDLPRTRLVASLLGQRAHLRPCRRRDFGRSCGHRLKSARRASQTANLPSQLGSLRANHKISTSCKFEMCRFQQSTQRCVKRFLLLLRTTLVTDRSAARAAALGITKTSRWSHSTTRTAHRRLKKAQEGDHSSFNRIHTKRAQLNT